MLLAFLAPPSSLFSSLALPCSPGVTRPDPTSRVTTPAKSPSTPQTTQIAIRCLNRSTCTITRHPRVELAPTGEIHLLHRRPSIRHKKSNNRENFNYRSNQIDKSGHLGILILFRSSPLNGQSTLPIPLPGCQRWIPRGCPAGSPRDGLPEPDGDHPDGHRRSDGPGFEGQAERCTVPAQDPNFSSGVCRGIIISTAPPARPWP